MKKSLLIKLTTIALSICSLLCIGTACKEDEPKTTYHTVTWQNYDGNVLEADENVKFGTMPTYDSEAPTRDSDAQYTYEFSGWSPEVTVVTGDVVYVAQFTSVVNEYTVVWKNYDGSILETDENVQYGETPVYSGETPVKEKDAQYTYEFSGWNPETDTVTGNVTYTAQFTSTVNKYTVTWKNYDGGVLETDENVAYGTTPAYNGETPTKARDAQYTYTFDGWDKTVDTVKGDAVYTAKFIGTVNKYTVTWKDYDGDVLETDENVDYGTLPTYNGVTPTRSRAEYTYTFSGWDKEVVTVTGDITYTAQYAQELSKYTVIWKNYDGTVLETDTGLAYQAVPEYNAATPTRTKDAQYTYTFSGWSPIVSEITDDIVYTAQYSTTINKYTVTWKNYDGTILETDTEVPYGETPVYNGATPVKEKDAQYTYTFNGWTTNVSKVTGDVVYTAKYSTTVNKYTITWKNYDGSTLKIDSVAYGTKPVYNGATPTKQGNEQYGYLFNGWSPTVANVTEDAVYTAQYSSSVNKYTVTWKNYDGTVLETDNNVAYGTVPTYNGSTPNKPYDSLNEYEFEGWSPKIESITGDTVYTALFSVSESTTFTVKYDANGGTGAPTSQTKNKGQSITLSSIIPTNGDHVFMGWACAYDENTYKAADTFEVDANVTLYAVWGHGCDTCGAKGVVPVSCNKCGGKGYIYSDAGQTCYSCSGAGGYNSSTTCAACGGDGVASRHCADCGSSNVAQIIGNGYSYYRCNSCWSTSMSTTCKTCYGSGAYNQWKTCIICDGNGKTPIDCNRCTGGHNDVKCSTCNGEMYFKNTTQSYKVTLKNGSSTFATKTVYYGGFFKLSVPIKTGYTFVGWFDAQENGKQYTDRNGVSLKVWEESNDKILYAQWIENYSIIYDLDNGSAENLTVYNIETPSFTINNPTKTGYTFIGWSGTNIDGMSMEVVIPSVSTGNREYTANWEINEYTISFVANNGQTIESITQKYATQLELPCPVRSEKSFVGWFDESLTTQFTSSTMPAENVTLYGKWIDYEVILSIGEIIGISVNDDLTKGSVYGVTAIDTDNNPVEVTAQLLSGSQTAATSITVRFVAMGLYDVYAMQMVSDIKVYGLPVIEYDSTKDYISDSDALVANLFTAMATDTYGETLSVNVSIKETEYAPGDTVTIILSTTDVVGNTTIIEIENVKYYGKPAISRDETVTAIKASDTISNELFNVTATDSFGESLTVSTEQYNGTFAGGYTITVKSSATDSKGNTASITYKVKVYSAPMITNATKTDFKEDEEITLSSLGIVAKDSFGNVLENVTLLLTDGTNTAGNTLTYLVTATDHLGSISTKTISVKIYGAPTITYDINKTAIKDTDEITAALLSATAKDTFGNTLQVVASLESGEIKGGYCIKVKLFTEDALGNQCTVVTEDIKVYAQEDIVLTYNAMLSNNIKKISCGEEFDAVATDSFGEPCIISVLPADGYTLTGGATISLYLVVTDKAGNTYTSDVLTEKNVYDTPTLTYLREDDYIKSDDNPYTLFVVKDSFGSERLFNIEVISGSLETVGEITYKITASDKVGNLLDCTYTLWVTAYDANGYLVYDKDGEQILLEIPTVETIIIPNGVTKIKEGIFVDNAIIKSIIIPNSVTSIEEGAFYGCSSLTEITIPFVGADKNATGYQAVFGYIFGYTTSSSSSTISGATYQYSTGYTYYHYYIPTSLKKVTITGGMIGFSAFYNCSSLTNVVIADGVTNIGVDAFTGCRGLTSITIPNSVTSIGEYAFTGCRGLTSITIPNSVTSIEEGAFYGCSSLTEITIPFVGAGKDATDYQAVFGYIFGYITKKSSSSHIGATYQYYYPYTGTYYHYYIPSTLKQVTVTGGTIGYSAFYNCISLTSIEIPDSVTSIGYSAFYNCISLTSIEIPDSVTSIGYSAFYNCSSLTSATIPDSVTSISSYAFYNCSSLISIEIPDGVTSIGDSAFYNCIRLTSIEIPDSVTSIGDSAFEGCSSLTDIEVNENNTKYKAIDGNLYSKDGETFILYASGNKATSFTIPDSVKSIDNRAFLSCSSLTEIIIPNSVTSIGEYAFTGCRGLTSITIPNSVTSIGNRAFFNCSSLTEIIIPDSVTSIGSYAFYGCSSLTSVVIGVSVTSIGSYAFYECSKLTSISFKDISTWYCTLYYENWENKTRGTQMSVIALSTNAEYFKSTYYDYYWYKL